MKRDAIEFIYELETVAQISNKCGIIVIYNKNRANLYLSYKQLGLSLRESRLIFWLLLFFSCIGIIPFVLFMNSIHGSPEPSKPVSSLGPVILDRHLKLELVYQGLKSPTDMAFLAQNDILVLERYEGTVRKVQNGLLNPEPLLKVPVSTGGERGLLGIAIGKQVKNARYIFLYYTGVEGLAVKPSNWLVRYEMVDDKLLMPKVIIQIPADISRLHNGGPIVVGKDGNVYLIVGDLKGPDPQQVDHFTGRSGVLRFSQEGEVVYPQLFGSQEPLDKYFAYGIRNGFGMDFDPITGNLWDSENGPAFHDEVNLVRPGFNSGWQKVQGISRESMALLSSGINNFGGRSFYSDPEFVWEKPVGVTAVKFLNSDKYGDQYENDLFVSDISNGNIYHFDLNYNRTELFLEGPLADKVANDKVEYDDILFGKGFLGNTSVDYHGITDLEVGPDGYLYILSYGEGAIYRVVPLSP